MKSNNMKRSAFIIVTFLFIALAAKGQSIEEIQTSKDYIWGTGNAATLKKADNEALAALISQISTNVSSKFEQLTEGGMKDDQATVDETFKSVINTYSRATLNNTRRIVIQNEPSMDGRQRYWTLPKKPSVPKRKPRWPMPCVITTGRSSYSRATPTATSSP